MQSSSLLTPNALAFIGLCNEYCKATLQAAESECSDFTASMLRLLPRLYIAATDLPSATDPDGYIEPVMDEDLYDSSRRSIESLMGADDTYLEVFEEDMKYSDTPIAASVSEGLCDILQVCYNFIETIRDAPEPMVIQALDVIKSDFESYWSRILCNVLRALNHIRYSSVN